MCMSSQRFTPAAAYRMVFLAFSLVIAGLVFRELKTLLVAILIVIIIALPLSAVADFLQRFRVPRVFGALVGLFILLGLIAGFVSAVVPAFNSEINRFAANLPHIVDSLRHRIGAITGTSADKVGRQLQSFVNGYTQHPSKLLGPLESIGASVATVLGAIIVGLLTALYIAIRPAPLVNGTIRVFPPPRRAQAARVLSLLRMAYLGWLKGLLIGMVVLGGLTYLGLRLVGLDFAGFFATFTAIAMIVPYFGALVSSLPPILYALTVSPEKAILVAIIYIAAHQLESNVIQPQVVARAVELHPAVVAVGVLAVEGLFGFVGLIVAVPILSTVKILVEELWIAPHETLERETGEGPNATTTPLGPPPSVQDRLEEARERAAQDEEQDRDPDLGPGLDGDAQEEQPHPADEAQPPNAPESRRSGTTSSTR